MKTTIVLETDKKRLAGNLASPERRFEFFESEQSAYLFHLEQTEVDSYILEDTGNDVRSLIRNVRNIRFLNEMVSIILFGEGSIPDELHQDEHNITKCSTIEELVLMLEAIPENKRKYNRVRWPVSAWFNGTNSLEGQRDKGMVTSISSGGCMIFSDRMPAAGEALFITIIFNDFDFLVEGVILRQDTRGFAVQFREISSWTQTIIQRIVDERILIELKNID
ncbi:MAG: PilZ domain-containing protein [Spirochaetales bacterium]|nr:PilZ domain-containing protein [Spirochaetales bacterium]